MRSGVALTIWLLAGAALAGCMAPDAGPAGSTGTGGPAATSPSASASATSGPAASGNETGSDPGDEPSAGGDDNRTDGDPSDGSDPGAEPEPDATASDPTVFECDGQTVDERHATHGVGDPMLASLSWAALKTGFRFVVAWESDAAYAGTLHYQVEGGAWRSVTESLPRTGHALVIDGLPEGQTLCFYAADGADPVSRVHGVRTSNAMEAYDEATGAYTLNLLTIANYPQSRSTLEGGYDVYARALWDMTDGHVRAGTHIVLYGDPDRTTFGFNGVQVDSSGDWAFDVVFQPDNPPFAGYTWLDGIQNQQDWIVMNSLHEAPPVNLFANPEREVGMVLAHELGHYAFGALDLYTSAGLGADCFDASTEISVMGADRDASELDDETNRCPNEDLIDGYVPSWTKLRQRFTEIPERPGPPDVGPDGDGGVFTFSAFDLAPGA